MAKRQTSDIAERGTDFYSIILEQLDNLKQMPFFGQMLSPLIDQWKKIIEELNNNSGGNLKTLFNSIAPCAVDSCSPAKDSILPTFNAVLDTFFAKNLSPQMTNMIKMIADIFVQNLSEQRKKQLTNY